MAPAPKTLFVLRHAKSSWKQPGLEDHERPLAPRGRRAAQLIAVHLRVSEIVPEFVLCSSARRARQTLEEVAPTGEVLVESGLYRAEHRALLQRLHRIPDENTSAMLIGHNPALQMLVSRLADDGTDAPEGALALLRHKFPTSALATLTFACDWSALEPGGAELTAFVRPKDLVC